MALKVRTRTVDGKKIQERWIDGKGWVRSYGSQPWATVTPKRIVSDLKKSLKIGSPAKAGTLDEAKTKKKKTQPRTWQKPHGQKSDKPSEGDFRKQFPQKDKLKVKDSGGTSASDKEAWLEKTRNSPAARSGSFSPEERWEIQKGVRERKAAKSKASNDKKVEKKKQLEIKKHKNKGSGRDGSFGKGTYGKGLPSNPQLKTQKKKKLLLQKLSNSFD